MRINAGRFNWTLAATMVLCLTFTLSALAQGPRGRLGQRAMAQSGGQVDQLAPLKRALQQAGAPALTSAQESSINALITNFRAAHVPTPDSAVQAARTAYDNAILNLQYDPIAAKTIVDEMTARSAARLKDGADFAISVVKVLDKGQLDLAVKQFGVTRTVRLLESLASSPGLARGLRQGVMAMRRSEAK